MKWRRRVAQGGRNRWDSRIEAGTAVEDVIVDHVIATSAGYSGGYVVELAQDRAPSKR